MIPGAQKSATTTIYMWLKQHPDVFLCTPKEPEFFLNETLFEKGIEFYSKEYFSQVNNQKLVGEASINYLASKEAAERIFDTFGAEMKFIVVLREPVSRINSAYWYLRNQFIETWDFYDALHQEPSRVEKLKFEKDIWWRVNYLDQSRYASNIRVYLSYFPIENFCFLLYEDILEDAKNSFLKICNFLNIDPNKAVDKIDFSNRFNASSQVRSKWLHNLITHYIVRDSLIKQLSRKLVPRHIRQNFTTRIHEINTEKTHYPVMTDDMREYCEKMLREEVDDLEEIIGRDLEIWKTSWLSNR